MSRWDSRRCPDRRGHLGAPCSVPFFGATPAHKLVLIGFSQVTAVSSTNHRDKSKSHGGKFKSHRGEFKSQRGKFKSNRR
jgi:hypothetical protein